MVCTVSIVNDICYTCILLYFMTLGGLLNKYFYIMLYCGTKLVPVKLYYTQ